MKVLVLLIFIQACHALRSQESSEERLPEWNYSQRRPPQHYPPYYRPRFFHHSGEEEHPSGYRPLPQRRDPYGDPYAYAKHLAEWGKNFGRSNGGWHSNVDDHKSEERGNREDSRELASSSRENAHSENQQQHQSHEKDESREAHKIDDLRGDRLFSHMVEGKGPNGFYSRGEFGTDDYKHQGEKAEKEADADEHARTQLHNQNSHEGEREKSNSGRTAVSYGAASNSNSNAQQAKSFEQHREGRRGQGNTYKH